MKAQFRIGEIAKMFNMNTSTLRYYDEIGILKSFRNEENRYRYYTIEQLDMLAAILTMRVMEIPIDDISNVMKNGEGNMCSLIDKHINLMEEKIENMKNVIKRAKRFKNRLESPQNVYEIMDRPPLWTVADPESKYLDVQVSEKINREIEERWLQFSNFSIIIDVCDFKEGRLNNYYEALISDESLSSDSPLVKSIDKAKCAHVFFLGNSEKDTIEEGKKLLQWVENEGWEAYGKIITHDLILEVQDEGKFSNYIDIWIPIK